MPPWVTICNNSMEMVIHLRPRSFRASKGERTPWRTLFSRIRQDLRSQRGRRNGLGYDGKIYALCKGSDFGAESDTDNLRWDEDSKRVLPASWAASLRLAATEAQVGKDLGVKANDLVALDEDDQRPFVVTRRPPFALKLDTNTRQEVARVPGRGIVRRCLLRRGAQAHLCARRRRIYQRGPTK